jgi:alpha-L-fucosidase
MSYQPTLASVKTHPLPAWYDDAKLGIFIHWGPYSVPAFAPRGEMLVEKMLAGGGFAHSPYAEWYWNSQRISNSPTAEHHRATYGANFRYEDFAPQFDVALGQWDPGEWAELFREAGARYVVLVTKHHDGFLMWPSRHPNPRVPGWSASRDAVGELSRSVRAAGLEFGVYYSSLLDWSFTRAPIQSLADLIAGSDTSAEYVRYVESHWLELIERCDPAILWSDIGYPPGYSLPHLFARFYNGRPEGVVNDRWMQLPKPLFSGPGRALLNAMLRRMKPGGAMPAVPHSDFTTPEYATLDRIGERKWETCRGIGNSFGYNALEDSSDYKTADELICLLADVVSKGGNLLLNVGPCADGSIHPLQRAALDGLGAWLKANGEAIYGTRPWARYGDTLPGGGEARYTVKEGALYVIVTKRPPDGELRLPVEERSSAAVLATDEPLPARREGGALVIALTSGEPIPALKLA